MSKRSNKATIESAGADCPRCRISMDRMVHPPKWIPSEKQSFYFTKWDRCNKCNFVQLYEKYKMQAVDFTLNVESTPTLFDN